MDETSRILGKIEQFQRATEARLNKIEHKIDDLYMFRWKMTGTITALLMAVEILIHAVGV